MEHFGNDRSGLVTGGMGRFCSLMNIVSALTRITYKVTITSRNVETFLSCLPHAVLCLYSLGLFGFSLPTHYFTAFLTDCLLELQNKLKDAGCESYSLFKVMLSVYCHQLFTLFLVFF